MRRPARTILAIVLAISALAIAASAAVASGGSSAAPPRADGGTHGPANIGTTPPVRACGTPKVQGEGPDGTVSFAPCDTNLPGPMESHVVVPTPGMADVRPVPFQSSHVEPDGRTVAVDFVAGIEPCSVLDHVDVRYGADAVTITLSEGSDPSAGQVGCIAIAEFKRVIVHLDQPLGDRSILDGVKAFPEG
jgi:hypothetical protein